MKTKEKAYLLPAVTKTQSVIGMCLKCTSDMLVMFKITDHKVRSSNRKAGYKSLEKQDSMHTIIVSIYKGKCCHTLAKPTA